MVKGKHYNFTPMWKIKKQTNEQTKGNKNRLQKQSSGYQGVEGSRKYKREGQLCDKG